MQASERREGGRAEKMRQEESYILKWTKLGGNGRDEE